MLNRALKILLIGCSLLVFCASQSAATEYAQTIEVKKMTFSWTIDGENLHGKMTGETEGWVGVGFNPSDKMKDANYVLGYVKKGEVKVVDEFGTTKTGHKTDEKIGGTENVTVVGGSEDNGVTTIEFIIPLNSGDEKDGIIDPAADTTVLLAYGAGRDSFRSKHKFRATVVVNLSTGEVK